MCLVLLMILVSGRFVKYLANAVAGNLEPGVIFAVIGYRIPGFLELTLPLAFFLAILLSFGRLYVETHKQTHTNTHTHTATHTHTHTHTKVKALEKRAQTEAGAKSMIWLKCEKLPDKIDSSAKKNYSKEELLAWATACNAKVCVCVYV